MRKVKDPIILREDDYNFLISYLKDHRNIELSDAKNAKELEEELKKAKLVSKEEFPDDVVRLDSRIKIKESSSNNVMEIVLVAPGKADIKKRKISVMAPVGTALIGFRKGQKINWQVPAGKKTFTILEVVNQ